ncbi:MAG TPA: helix-turn-helix transcriptional regulator [Mycobacteriales bacterium]|nr:helix-turn-helix transcriptional regulator [Mycobacteriales bacterium]
MVPVAGPTVVRRQLGRRLKRMRETAGRSVEHVVANRHLGISRAKLYKLEAGHHPAKPQDVAALCRFFGAAEEDIDTMTALALATQGASWWHVYGEDAVPEWFSLYVDLEPAAKSIRTYEAELVPGLLQTRDYATAVYQATSAWEDVAEIDRRVTVRMKRQAILDRPEPPNLHVVLNEAAILRQVGGAEVIAEQVAKLRKAAQRPGVTVDILPLAAGAHAAMATPFLILDFPDPAEDPSVVYLDTPSSAAYLQKPTDLTRYAAMFDQLLDRTTPLLEYLS